MLNIVLSHTFAVKFLNFPASVEIHVNKFFGSHCIFEEGFVHSGGVADQGTIFVDRAEVGGKVNASSVASVEIMKRGNAADHSAAKPALFTRKVHAGSAALTEFAALRDSGVSLPSSVSIGVSRIVLTALASDAADAVTFFALSLNLL